MIRDFAKKLTAFKDFVDWIVIEAKFQRGNFISGEEILKNHSAMVLIRISSENAELFIKMIRPRKKISPAVGCRVQFHEKSWRTFTATEIFDFADQIGDQNPIHQLNPPIVPAFLLLESLFEEFSPDFIKVKFKNFITAGESLTLQRSNNNFEIICAGIKKVSGEFA